MALPRGLEQLNIDTDSSRHRCGHCKNDGCADLISSFKFTSTDEDSGITVWTSWYIVFCPLCKEITIKQISKCSENGYYEYTAMGELIYMLNEDVTQLYPLNGSADLPGMSNKITGELVEDYEEAANIAELSPRSAAALLRLLLEKLCKQYLSKSHPEYKKLDRMIAFLVSDGAPVEIQQSCDILRVTGNETVHAGTIDIRDNPENVSNLFELVNIVAEYLHVKYKKIPEMYSLLPQDKLKGIKDRDANAK